MTEPTWRSRAAEGIAWLIAGSAWIQSFHNQLVLALRHGFVGWEAWFWPTTTELAALACLLLALDAIQRGLSATQAWLWSGAAAVVMIAANVAVDWGDPVGIVMHAWPSVLAVGIWDLLIHGRRPATPAPDPAAATNGHRPAVSVVAANGHPAAATAAVTALTTRRPAVTDADLLSAATELESAGQPVIGRTLAGHFGVSQRTGQRLRERWELLSGISAPPLPGQMSPPADGRLGGPLGSDGFFGR